MHNPFRYFNSSPEVIRSAVMLYVRYPLSLRQVEDLVFERGIDICHETVRYWWNRFGPLFAAEIRKRRIHRGSYSLWRWHLDEVFWSASRKRARRPTPLCYGFCLEFDGACEVQRRVLDGLDYRTRRCNGGYASFSLAA